MKNDIKFVPVAPKTYEVRYVENQEVKVSPLSAAARSKVIPMYGSNYLSENQEECGPCRNSLCGCSCSSNTCTCKNFEWKTKDAGAGFSGSGRAWHEMNDAGASGRVSAHMFNLKANDVESSIMSASIGGEVGATPVSIDVKGQLGVDFIDIKSDGVRANIGLNVNSGVSVGPNGAEIKVLGFGFEAGDKIGISTPIGGLSVDTDECVVQ